MKYHLYTSATYNRVPSNKFVYRMVHIQFMFSLGTPCQLFSNPLLSTPDRNNSYGIVNLVLHLQIIYILHLDIHLYHHLNSK